MSSRTWVVTGSRFMVLVGLAFWLGGLVFLGAVAAPLTFKISRAHESGILAPQIVGAMVTRFNTVTYVCGVLLLLGWVSEKFGGRAAIEAAGNWGRKLWWAQGLCSGAMLLIALYAGLVLMPRLNTLQTQVLPLLARIPGSSISSHPTPSAPADESRLSSSERALKAEFDAGHQQYQQISMVGWWLGLLVLLMLCLRTALPANAELVKETLAQKSLAEEPLSGRLVGAALKE